MSLKENCNDIFNLLGAKKLPSVLDLSNFKEAVLSWADFYGVKKVKWPKENCVVTADDINNWPKHIRMSYKIWERKQKIYKFYKEQKNCFLIIRQNKNKKYF